MINKNNYPKAYREVIEILKYIPLNDYNKIPKHIIEKMTREMDQNYQYSVTNANGDESKLKLMIDDGVPFYQYHEELKEGSTIDYNYGLATLDAYKLLRRELNGENPHKLINEYLLSLNKDMLSETLDKYNLDYMNEVISGRLKEIKRRYPL